MPNSGSSSPATGRTTPRAATSPSTPTHKRLALAGHSAAFDPRIDAARGDLADLRLADRMFAPHYAAAVLRTVVSRAPLSASVGGAPLSEVLPGEAFEVLELAEGHAWGRSPVDRVVGFVAADALGPHIQPPAAEPELAEDFVAVAEGLIGTPALAGGRSPAGVDGAGLVFFALLRAGIRPPRFADLQLALGHPVGDSAPMLRGDLVFAGGDVAIATDETHVLGVREQVERFAMADPGGITARRRLP